MANTTKEEKQNLIWEIIIYLVLSYYFIITFYQSRHLGKQPKPTLDCIANQADFHPFLYGNDEELNHILSYQGTTNVTQRFYKAYFYGCVLYPVMLAYSLHCYGLSGYNRAVSKVTVFLFQHILKIFSYILIFYIIVARFSHSGKVCSGDYNYMFLEQNTPLEGK